MSDMNTPSGAHFDWIGRTGNSLRRRSMCAARNTEQVAKAIPNANFPPVPNRPPDLLSSMGFSQSTAMGVATTIPRQSAIMKKRARELSPRKRIWNSQVHLACLLLEPKLHGVVESAERQICHEEHRQEPQECSNLLRRKRLILKMSVAQPIKFEAGHHQASDAQASAHEGAISQELRHGDIGQNSHDDGKGDAKNGKDDTSNH
mmetsp:Transcript_83589/g.159482  ORF Transcript_83589/g.159482 Transcript_83589/m.159482 type:complete len:204 (-) Transcript_83589:934-1545(-)